MSYQQYSVKLSDNQKRRLEKVMKDKSPITIRLSHKELTGNDELMLSKTQIKRLQKAKTLNKGADIKISKSQITKVVKHGGNLFSSLMQLGAKMLPMATKFASVSETMKMHIPYTN